MLFVETTPDLYMLTPVLTLIIMVFFMILMIYFYGQIRNFPIILIIFLFSVVMGVYSLGIENVPFTPYWQIFFITIQGVMFTLTAFEQAGDIRRIKKR